jgi:hypothetical protein
MKKLGMNVERNYEGKCSILGAVEDVTVWGRVGSGQKFD